MSNYIVCITGLMQPEKISNGVGDLALELRKADVNVFLRKWKDHDFLSLVMGLDRATFRGGSVYLAGHSYGGWRANEVAGMLNELGKPVAGLFLCDAVERRHPKHGTIHVPSNVDRLYLWRQAVSPEIHGSEIETDNTKTVIMKDVHVTDRGHHQIDSLPDFHQTVIRVLTGEE